MATSPSAAAAGLLGLPALPPAGLVVAANRFRQGAQRAAGAGPAFVVVVERLMGIYDNVVLGLLCRHDVPEALDRGPADAAEVARQSSSTEAVDPDALHRVLRYAAMRGFVGRNREGRFTANACSRQLAADHPLSVRGWVAFLNGPAAWGCFAAADEALHGRSPSIRAHGVDFFAQIGERSPADGEAFHQAMASGSHVQALLLADAFDFASTRTVVDVGGGTGGLARVLLEHHPHLEATVLDLPAVAEAGAEAASTAPWSARCHFEGGDFFEEVPAGADTYTLLAVLHDWGHDDALRILTTVRTAMVPGARCLVVDAVLDDRRPAAFTAATDVMMLLLTEGGRERTVAEWDELVTSAGLRVERRTLLATGFTLHELVRT